MAFLKTIDQERDFFHSEHHGVFPDSFDPGLCPFVLSCGVGEGVLYCRCAGGDFRDHGYAGRQSGEAFSYDHRAGESPGPGGG